MTTADDAHACGLPGLGLMAVQVRRGTGGSGGESSGSGGSLRGAEPRLFPLLLTAADLPPGDAMAEDATGSTLVLAAPELACDRLFMLAKLTYRMVSGRETPDAVALSQGAYVAVSALSEQGNAILCEALGRSATWDSCLELLQALARAQNLSLKGGGSGPAETSSSGSGRLLGAPEPRSYPMSVPSPRGPWILPSRLGTSSAPCGFPSPGSINRQITRIPQANDPIPHVIPPISQPLALASQPPRDFRTVLLFRLRPARQEH